MFLFVVPLRHEPHDIYSGSMTKKVRDRLVRIEQALKDLIKEVGKLHPVPHRLTNEGSDDTSPPHQTSKVIEKTGQEALRKKRTRTPRKRLPSRENRNEEESL